jgi:hypothetical protein
MRAFTGADVAVGDKTCRTRVKSWAGRKVMGGRPSSCESPTLLRLGVSQEPGQRERHSRVQNLCEPHLPFSQGTAARIALHSIG